MIVTEIRPPEEVPRLLQRVARRNIRDAGIWRHRRKDGTPIDVEIASTRSYSRPARADGARERRHRALAGRA